MAVNRHTLIISHHPRILRPRQTVWRHHLVRLPRRSAHRPSTEWPTNVLPACGRRSVGRPLLNFLSPSSWFLILLACTRCFLFSFHLAVAIGNLNLKAEGEDVCLLVCFAFTLAGSFPLKTLIKNMKNASFGIDKSIWTRTCSHPKEFYWKFTVFVHNYKQQYVYFMFDSFTKGR